MPSRHDRLRRLAERLAQLLAGMEGPHEHRTAEDEFQTIARAELRSYDNADEAMVAELLRKRWDTPPSSN